MTSKIQLLELYRSNGGARFRTVPATHDEPIDYRIERCIVKEIDTRE
jgi:hypothetical protein